MTDVLTQAKSRLQRYWNVDGLHEIAIAILFLITAGWSWGEKAAPQSRLWKGVFAVGFPLVLCGGILMEGRAVRAVRERLAYRRTGFVEFRKPSRRIRAISAVTGAIVAVLIALFVAKQGTERLERFWVPGLGSLVGLFLVRVGWAGGTLRFVSLGAASVVAGALIGYAGLGISPGMSVYYAAIGGLFLVSGGMTLRRYLKIAPEPVEE